MKVWLRDHGLAVRDAGGRLGRQAIATLLNLIVMGVALSLPVGLYVTVKNLSGLVRGGAPEAQLTLFLKVDAQAPDVSAIGARLQQHPAVGRVQFVPKDKALDDLKRATGMTSVVEDLGRNPLPDAYVVTGRPDGADALQALQTDAAGWPGVDVAQMDSVWAKQIEAALRAGRASVGILAIILGVALVAVTFNTIRLQILARREEIEVSKLIGATNAFIRRPFLYFGALQGLLGAVVAWGLAEVAAHILERELGVAVSLISPTSALQRLDVREVLALGGIATALGWLGAWISVTFHLRQLDPA